MVMPIIFACSNVKPYLKSGLGDLTHTGTFNSKPARTNGNVLETSKAAIVRGGAERGPFTITLDPSPDAVPAVPVVYYETECDERCILQADCGMWEPCVSRQVAHFTLAYKDATFLLDPGNTMPVVFVQSAGATVGIISVTIDELYTSTLDQLAYDWQIDPERRACSYRAAREEMAA